MGSKPGGIAGKSRIVRTILIEKTKNKTASASVMHAMMPALYFETLSVVIGSVRVLLRSIQCTAGEGGSRMNAWMTEL